MLITLDKNSIGKLKLLNDKEYVEVLNKEADVVLNAIGFKRVKDDNGEYAAEVKLKLDLYKVFNWVYESKNNNEINLYLILLGDYNISPYIKQYPNLFKDALVIFDKVKKVTKKVEKMIANKCSDFQIKNYISSNLCEIKFRETNVFTIENIYTYNDYDDALNDMKVEGETSINEKILNTLKEKFRVSIKDKLTVTLPKYLYNKVKAAYDSAIEKENAGNGVFNLADGTWGCEKFRKRLLDSLMLFTSTVYNNSGWQERNRGTFFGYSKSGNYLRGLYGELRNKSRIHFTGIKNILFDNDILEISDLFTHYGSDWKKNIKLYNKDAFKECYLYSLKGFSKQEYPKLVNIDDELISNNPNYSEDDLELVEYDVTDERLLGVLSDLSVAYLKIDKVKNIQKLLLTTLYFDQTVANHPAYQEYIANGQKSIDGYCKACRIIRFFMNKELDAMSFTISTRVGRTYNNLTYMKSELRHYLLSELAPNKKLRELDFKSSQYTLLALRYADSAETEEEKVKRFEVVRWLADNDIHQEVANYFGITRKDAKPKGYKYMFSCNQWAINQPLHKFMMDKFPEFAEWICEQRGDGIKTLLAKILQTEEAELVLGRSGESLKESTSILAGMYKKGLFGLSIHDAVIFFEGCENDVLTLAKMAFEERFGNLVYLMRQYCICDKIFRIEDL